MVVTPVAHDQAAVGKGGQPGTHLFDRDILAQREEGRADQAGVIETTPGTVASKRQPGPQQPSEVVGQLIHVE